MLRAYRQCQDEFRLHYTEGRIKGGSKDDVIGDRTWFKTKLFDKSGNANDVTVTGQLGRCRQPDIVSHCCILSFVNDTGLSICRGPLTKHLHSCCIAQYEKHEDFAIL
jgi:hypothetical protein